MMDNASDVSNHDLIAESLTSLFRKKFGTSSRLFVAPGRVNLIGDHTDYNDGFVMPAAIGFYTWIAAAKRPEPVLTAFSDRYNEEVVFALDDLSGPPRNHWSDFVRGVAATLQEAGHKLDGANLVIHGDVPLGAGLSSSASLEVAVGLALAEVSSLSVPRLQLVRLCQRAEHEYVGTRCGIMDQFIVAFGAASHALMLDCRSLDYELLPIPPGLSLLLCNSMVRHELASGEYNLRRADCEAGVKLLQEHLPDIGALRDVIIGDLERFKQILPEQVYRRCRHVVGESRRVLDAASAFKASDAHLFGQLMYQSHASLRDDYEVSCKEIDTLVEIASTLPGVYGARMTGGGFGGCTVNLVRTDLAGECQATLAREYENATGIAPSVYICEAVQGAAVRPAQGATGT